MTFKAQFIAMFEQPIRAWAESSIIGRAQKNSLIDIHIESILNSVRGNHHKVDDTPYGGGPGELMRIDVVEPLIKKALGRHHDISRAKKRVVMLDPAGTPFNQDHAKRLASYHELIFVCGRYEGIDARIHHFVDEAISLGDFVLSNGDVAAMAVFDACVRMQPGFLGNYSSIEQESHMNHRLEASHYTRPREYHGFLVPQVFQNGNHQEIDKAR
ncbi:MAG: tRNA (guanosine(37)-N1)-methyltransferase TrmD, partial [Myxococcales bacterium]|nr:tRNA (guanosine(37)-N1)-methyltransferase TrmD [Myxococcales bacterium]